MLCVIYHSFPLNSLHTAELICLLQILNKRDSAVWSGLAIQGSWPFSLLPLAVTAFTASSFFIRRVVLFSEIVFDVDAFQSSNASSSSGIYGFVLALIFLGWLCQNLCSCLLSCRTAGTIISISTASLRRVGPLPFLWWRIPLICNNGKIVQKEHSGINSLQSPHNQTCSQTHTHTHICEIMQSHRTGCNQTLVKPEPHTHTHT